MKKITLFSILAAFMAVFAFTSCNTGSSDSTSYLTKEQQDSYQAAMAFGSYDNMKLLWEKKNDANVKNQTDSVDTYCTVSMYKDSVITIANFPIAELAEHISDKDLSAAIAKEAPRTIRCKYMVLPNSTQTVAYFWACPEVLTLNLTYGEASHKVQFVFSYNSYYAGFCTLSGTRQIAFQFLLYQIWVDDKQTNYIKNAATGYNYVNFAVRPAYSQSNK